MTDTYITKVLWTDTIECPNCGHVQQADVTWTEGDFWQTYIKDCEKCGLKIMESEWLTVKDGRDA